MFVRGNIIRLFVSSTFSEFAAERDVLQRDVFPVLRHVCAEAGFRFQPIDLRWGVSQEAADEGRILSICFEEIRRAQRVSPDLNFLILLGEHYGTRLMPEVIPAKEYHRLVRTLNTDLQHRLLSLYAEDRNIIPESGYVLITDRNAVTQSDSLREALLRAARALELPDEDTLKYYGSATHQEIQQGLLNNSCDPSAVLCVLRATAAEANLQGSVDIGHGAADISAQEDLVRLKAAVESRLADDQILRYTVKMNGGTAHLDRHSLAQAFLALMEPRIREVIARRATKQRGDPISVANRSFAEERRTTFVGRIHELDSVRRYLSDPDSQFPLVVTGSPGCGKSTLLVEAIQRLQQDDGHPVVATRYIGVTPTTSSVHDLVVGLHRTIASAFKMQEPDPLDDEGDLIAGFLKALGAIPHERRLILVIDALEQLDTSPQRVDWIPSQLQPNVRMFVSVAPERLEYQSLEARLPDEQIITLGPMSAQDGSNLLESWLAAENRTLQPAQFAKVLGRFEVEGLPLYLRLAFEAARRWRSFDMVGELPTAVIDLLRDAFASLGADSQSGPKLVERSLGYISSARNGLAEDELLDMLARDDAVRADQQRLSPSSPPLDGALPLPAVLWLRLYAELASYLVERELDGTSLITFYHRQVREVAETLFLSADQRMQRHAALGRYFAAQTSPLEWINIRVLSELPYHQMRAALPDELRRTLTDRNFLEAKVALLGTSELVADLEFLPGDAVLQSIKRAIIAGRSVLENKADEIENQLFGREDAAQHLHGSQESRPRFCLTTQTLISLDSRLLRTFAPNFGAIDTESPVAACAFSPNGERVLSVSTDGYARLWDVQTGTLLQAFEAFIGYSSLGKGLCAFRSDGSEVLVFGGTPMIHFMSGQLSGSHLTLKSQLSVRFC